MIEVVEAKVTEEVVATSISPAARVLSVKLVKETGVVVPLQVWPESR